MSIVQGGMDREESKALLRFLDGATVQNHEGRRMVDMHCSRPNLVLRCQCSVCKYSALVLNLEVRHSRDVTSTLCHRSGENQIPYGVPDLVTATFVQRQNRLRNLFFFFDLQFWSKGS